MVGDKSPGTASVPNYGKQSFKNRLFNRLRNEFADRIQETPLRFRAYPSYWHYILHKKENYSPNSQDHFLTQKPDYRAGIGHQLANWNSGLYFSNLFNVKYAHTPFSAERWERFFGFGENEESVFGLMSSSKYKKVRLPRFDSTNQEHIELIRSIINSYSGQSVLFLLEINQGYARQADTANVLRDKFFNAPARASDQLIFKRDSYNIAVHIRRRMAIENDEMWKDRGLDNTYFSTVLQKALEAITTDKKIEIFLFSQGKISDFPEFAAFPNLNFCLDMNPYDSFLHMVYADLLISSKSSFSYKPALISKGIKICPESFWHVYPDESTYVLADNNADFDVTKLSV